LEDRDARLALEIALAEPFQIVDNVAPLAFQGIGELLEGHGLALGGEIGVAGPDIDDGQVLVREALEDGDGLPSGLEEEVTEHFPRRPLPGPVALVQMRLHAVELRPELRPRLVRDGSELLHLGMRHGLCPPLASPARTPAPVILPYSQRYHRRLIGRS